MTPYFFFLNRQPSYIFPKSLNEEVNISSYRSGGGLSSILIQKLPVAAWFEYINEPTLADAILDRLLEQTHRIEIRGESMRKRKKLQEKQLQ